MPTRPPIERRHDSDGQLVFCINGILTRPDSEAWTDRAEKWFLRNTEHDADSYEYFQSAIIGRLFSEPGHLKNAGAMLAEYIAKSPRPPLLHIVAHSRGCEIARRLVVDYRVPVQSLHLVAAAIDADFKSNGLNAALRSGLVNRVRLYTSKGDGVLQYIAGLSLGLYGRLGYTGPRNVDPDVARRVEIIERNTFNHSTWFNAQNFSKTMELVEWEVDNLPMR